LISSDDYLIRQVVQLVDAVNAIISGTPADIPEEEIAESIDAAYGQLLGQNRALVDMLDTESAARLVGATFQVRAYVDVLLTDAAYQRHRGETQKCADLAVRAEAFLGTLPKSDEDRDRHGRVAALLTTEPYR